MSALPRQADFGLAPCEVRKVPNPEVAAPPYQPSGEDKAVGPAYGRHHALGISRMRSIAKFITVALVLLMPALAFAGPAEDASAVVDRWSAAYSANDPEEVVKNYWPDALLFGTVSPIMSEGTNAIGAYFARLKGSGNKNVIGEKRTIVLGDAAVVVAGFYEFTLVQEGKPTPFPARFTMLVTKRDGVWHIVHHHSSPLVLPKK